MLEFENNKILAIVVILFLTFSCKKEEKAVVKQEYKGPLSEIYGINMTYSDSARLVVRMNTEVQLTLANEDKIYPKEVRIFFFDKQGRNNTTLRGDSARFIRNRNIYHIMGRVKVDEQVKQEVIETDEMYWSPDQKRVYTDAPVHIKTPTQTLHGVGMDANQDFTKSTIRKPYGVGQMSTPIQ